MTHRRAQAAALVLLSALVVGSAVLGPLYARALEHGLLRDALARASVVDTGLVVEQGSTERAVPSPAQVQRIVPETVRSAFDAPVALVSGQVVLGMAPSRGGQGVQTTAYAPLAGCADVKIITGRCPTTAGEVLVSAAEAAFEGWRTGDRVPLVATPGGQLAPGDEERRVRVSGTYDALDDDGAWFGVRLTGRAGTQAAVGLGSVPRVDTPIVAPAFFDVTPTGSTLRLTATLRRDELSVDALPGLVDGIAALEAASASSTGGSTAPRVQSGLDQIGRTVVAGQAQAAVLVPLLLGQLALFSLVILGLASSAAVEQRRPEIALARLRGDGVRGVRRMLVSELGLLVALGVPVGFGLAVGADLVASRVWLPAGVPFEVPWTAYAAAGLALVAGVGAVVVTSRPVLREPIPSLLRRIPPRQRGFAIGLLDAVIIAVAAAGVVAIVTGDVSGPVAMATPALLALAVGLLLALLLVPVAGGVGRLALGRGRAVTGLTAVQVARRPAVRRVVAIVTVATALTVFVTDAYLTAARNRDGRATLEAGAQVVLHTDSEEPALLRSTLRMIDPSSSYAVPLARLLPPNASAFGTVAVVPSAMPRIALPASGAPATASASASSAASAASGSSEVTGAGPPWSALAAPASPSTVLTGPSVAVTVTADVAASGAGLDGATPGRRRPPNAVPVALSLQRPDGSGATVSLGLVPFDTARPRTLTARVPCGAAPCTLVGISVDRHPDEVRAVVGRLTVLGIRAGTAPALPLGAQQWESYGSPFALDRAAAGVPGFAAITVDPAAPQRMDLRFGSTGGVISATLTRPRLPAIVVPGPGGPTRAPDGVTGFSGNTVPVTEKARAAYGPQGVTNVVLVDYDALAAEAGRLYATGSLDVLVGDRSRLQAVTTALDGAGIGVRSVTDRAELLDSYDRSASAWGLRLGLVVGGLALLLAALVLVLVTITSWRGRSKDLAALRLAGVPASTVRRVGIAEQLVVIVLAVVVGALCGALGSRLSLALIPFFTTPSDVFVADLTPNLGAMALAALATVVWLSVVAVVLGLWLARRSTVARVRESA
ncbi:FtsX-like permease family protein [Terrabacter sp. NPDC000476]|uniref:FtsX-like permease family protein n=1 Tax=Terrabacter sp. NPDC000476 TaxID=3154258 RepID=UPI00332C899D